jgi:hypothetical protein
VIFTSCKRYFQRIEQKKTSFFCKIEIKDQNINQSSSVLALEKMREKLKLFTMSLVIILTACQNDFEELTTKQFSSSQITSEKRTIEQVLNEIKNPLVKDFIINNQVPNFLKRNSDNNQKDYLEFDLYIKPNDYDTYSLLVENYATETPYFKFIIIQKKGENESAGFAKYIPDNKLTEFNLKRFNGVIQFYDTENNLKAESVLINGIAQPKTQQKSRIATFSTICTDKFVTIVHNCSHGGEHPPGTFCANGDPSDGYYEYTWVTTCQEYENPSLIKLPDAFIGGTGGGAVIPEEVISDNCNNLKAKSADANFNSNISDLNADAASSTVETAKIMYKNAPNYSPKIYGSLDSNGNSFVKLNPDPTRSAQILGLMHCHQDFTLINKNLAVFSITDFVGFGKLIENSSADVSEYITIVTGSNGTFALKLTNKQALIDLKNYIENPSTNQEAEDLFNKSIKNTMSVTKQIEGLLQFINETTPDGGIELYQMNNNNEWELKQLDDNNKVKSIKCF